MFEKIQNIEAAYKEVRRIAIIAICSCTLMGIVAHGYHYAKIKRMQNQIYVLADGKVMQAYTSSRSAHIAVEAEDHIRNFHQYFFRLDPDAKQIKNGVGKALYLADYSAKKTFDDLSKQGYYTKIISSNTSQRITIDNIQLNLNQHPYSFRCYATQESITSGSIVTRNLITEGQLRTVSRSKQNLHGFLIENWKVIAYKDLKTQYHKQP